MLLTSDALFYAAMGYRLIDSAFVPLGYGDGDVALQMTMIDLQTFGVVSSVLWGSQALVGRTRPVAERLCQHDPKYAQQEELCQPNNENRRRSFIAGHPAVGFASAGLTCSHHRHIPLYGEPGDTLACSLSLAAAAANGVGRILTQRHYPSDLWLGIALGLGSGWLLPEFLHYRANSPAHFTAGEEQPIQMLLLPNFDDRQAGARLTGVF